MKQRISGTAKVTETGPIKVLRIYRRELSRRLRDWRRLVRKTVQDVQSELDKILQIIGAREHTEPFVELIHEELREKGKGVEWLERDDPVDINLSIASLEIIACAYGIHRLLLDPLLAPLLQVDCVVQGRNDFVEVSQLEGATSYGWNAHYLFPTSRLSGMDNAAIVWLKLDPGGFPTSTTTKGPNSSGPEKERLKYDFRTAACGRD